MTRYESAKEIYARYGVDTDKAIALCKEIPVSLHCCRGMTFSASTTLGG